MRPYSTLCEFHEKYMVKEGVDFSQWIACCWVEEKEHKSMIERVRDFRSGYQWLLNPNQHVRTWGWLSKPVRTWKKSTAEISKDWFILRVKILSHVREITWKSSRILSINKTLKSFRRGWLNTHKVSYNPHVTATMEPQGNLEYNTITLV